MAEKRWASLVRDLGHSGYDSPYLDRLRRRLDAEQAYADLEAEIVRETAAALGRAAEKVDHALLRLQLAADELQRATETEARRRAAERFNKLREQALAVRHELIIHREAVGLRRNEIIERLYPIPASVSYTERS